MEKLNSTEQCFIDILKVKNDISTDEMLELAMIVPTCSGCKDGNSVIAAGMDLARKGLVKARFENKTYFWSLA